MKPWIGKASIIQLLLGRTPIIAARGLSIQKIGKMDTLVTQDGGRIKPLENKGEYLKDPHVVATVPSRFLGQRVTWQMPLESMMLQVGVTRLFSRIKNYTKLSEKRAFTHYTKVLVYFPGGDFIENFMDFAPYDELEITGEVCARRESDSGYTHTHSSVYLKGIRAMRVGDERSTVLADKGRVHPIENPEAFRKRYYVARRTLSKYIGKEVTWRGKVGSVNISSGDVRLDIYNRDLAGNIFGTVALYFRDVSYKDKLAVFKGKKVIFTGKVLKGNQFDNRYRLPLEGVSVMFPGNPSSKIEVPRKDEAPPGPGPTEQPDIDQ